MKNLLKNINPLAVCCVSLGVIVLGLLAYDMYNTFSKLF